MSRCVVNQIQLQLGVSACSSQRQQLQKRILTTPTPPAAPAATSLSCTLIPNLSAMAAQNCVAALMRQEHMHPACWGALQLPM
jgi:hypothetical protein